ncbi:MAG: thioredoxin [Lachnospiraceae bacterium]|nr:thioredoxin [Lachnospiraceae bacterium]
MGLSLYKIRKWTNMICGNSVYHVNQGIGKCYSKDTVAGYYNDLTEKVTRFGFENDSVPITTIDSGEKIYFPGAIFQYGLGAYDLYLINNDESSLRKMLNCADWAVHNQQPDGGWDTFSFENPEHPYSSMAQAEGISLLIRAHIQTNKEMYFDTAKKALHFMLTPIAEGGTTLYIGEDILLYEYTYEPLILNGWIFSIWGLYDYCKYTEDSKIQHVLDTTISSLKKKIPEFDMKYWSKYEDGKRICSPFYHRLHIAQLSIMYDLFGDHIYKEYAEKWEKYLNNFWKPKRAFLKKAMQKILE